MIVLGLTGSIGMGKSTTARLFEEAGAPTFDADAAVHALYAPGGDGAAAVAALFPGVVGPNGVDRSALRTRIAEDPTGLRRLESVIHPLVARRRDDWLRRRRLERRVAAVLDIPLLLEAAAPPQVDGLIVVSAPAGLQKARVLARPGMTVAAFQAILARQAPDSIKRARADVVIDTSRGVPAARRQVRNLVARLRRDGAPASWRGYGPRNRVRYRNHRFVAR